MTKLEITVNAGKYLLKLKNMDLADNELRMNLDLRAGQKCKYDYCKEL